MVSNVLVGAIMGIVAANLVVAGAIAIGATEGIKIFGEDSEHTIYLEDGETGEKIGYIKIEGIEGECKEDGHEGWSEILSFDQSVQRGESWYSGGRVYGGAQMGDIVIIKDLDK
mgnify:FL=1